VGNVVDEDVARAVLGEHLLRELVDLLVGAESQVRPLAAPLPPTIDAAASPAPGQVDQDHVVPVRCQPTSAREADAATRPVTMATRRGDVIRSAN